MKIRNFVIIAAAVAVPATMASGAAYNHVGGTACDAHTDFAPLGFYAAYGLMNFSPTNDARPVCEVPFASTTIGPTTMNPSQGRVDYFDQTNVANASNTGAVRCAMNLSIAGGTIVGMGVLYSCATPGGCSSGNNTFIGTGYLLFPDTVGSTANVVATNYDCVLPPYQGGFLGSSISAVAVSTSTP